MKLHSLGLTTTAVLLFAALVLSTTGLALVGHGSPTAQNEALGDRPLPMGAPRWQPAAPHRPASQPTSTKSVFVSTFPGVQTVCHAPSSIQLQPAFAAVTDGDTTVALLGLSMLAWLYFRNRKVA